MAGRNARSHIAVLRASVQAHAHWGLGFRGLGEWTRKCKLLSSFHYIIWGQGLRSLLVTGAMNTLSFSKQGYARDIWRYLGPMRKEIADTFTLDIQPSETCCQKNTELLIVRGFMLHQPLKAGPYSYRMSTFLGGPIARTPLLAETSGRIIA